MYTAELKRIGTTNGWYRLIDSIVTNFSGVEFDSLELVPAEEITYILRQIKPEDSEGMKEKLLIQKMAKIEAFQFRAMKFIDGRIETWNPLEQRYVDFIKDAEQLHVYQDEAQFPPADVLRANFSYMLSQHANTH